jgi:hypothetical protein
MATIRLRTTVNAMIETGLPCLAVITPARPLTR